MKLYFFIYFLLFFINNSIAQSTFIQYEEKSSGKKIASAEGILIENERFKRLNQRMIQVEITPLFKNNKYYLLMGEYKLPKGKFINGWDSPYALHIKHGEFIYLILKLNQGEEILVLPGRMETVSGNDFSSGSLKAHYKDVEFEITKSNFKKLALATSLSIKVSLDKESIFRDYDYDFDSIEGFSDFAKGLKIIE